MAEIKRSDAREETFRLLFETEFQSGRDPQEVYALAVEDREFPEDTYIKTVYFGVNEHLAELDAWMARHSNGWKPNRISTVSRCVIRLCIYEMLYMKDIPMAVSLNEAIELVKKFDDPKMRAFTNGLLNGVKDEIEASRKE